MALFQPSNIIPSSFGGVDETTVDVSANVSISWQVNGNSAMTGFNIDIYNNITQAYITNFGELGTSRFPFYGVDNKGNPIQFVYNTNTTWADLGLSNGNEYKMIITQYWGAGNANSVTQYSGSVFFTREKPTLTIKYDGNAPIDNAFTIQQATATFTADLSIPTIAINAVRWVIKNSSGAVLDDTGFINTPILSYTYDGLFSGETYTIECTVETENKVSVSTGEITLNVSYTEATITSDLLVDCQTDNSVLVSWNTATNIPGTLSSGTIDIDDNGYLNLADEQNATWNEENGESMNFPAPYSLAWKGEIGLIITKDYQITTTPTVTTDTQTIQKSQSNYILSTKKYGDYNTASTFSNNNRDIVFCDNLQKFFTVDLIGNIKSSIDGEIWNQVYSFADYHISDVHLVYGNGYLFLIGTNINIEFGNSIWAWMSEDAINWESIGTATPVGSEEIYATAVAYYDSKFFVAMRYDQANVRKCAIFVLPAISSVLPYQWSIKATFNSYDSGDYAKQLLPVDNSQIIVTCKKVIRVLQDTTIRESLNLINDNDIISGVAYGNGVYAALADTKIFLSNDLSSWTNRGTPSSSICYTLSFNTGYFLLVSNSTSNPYYISFNCQSWYTLQNKPSSSDDFIEKWKNMELIAYDTLRNKWVNISKVSDLSVSFNIVFTATAIKIINEWVHSWIYTSESKIRSIKVNPPISSSGLITTTVETYEPLLNITLTYTLYSNYSYAETPLTLPFTQGIIAGLKELSKTTGADYTNLTFTDDTITITGLTIPTPNAQASETQITLNLAVIYNSQFGETAQTVISLNSGEYTAKLSRVFGNTTSADSELNYKLDFYNNSTLIGSIELEPTMPTTNSSYEILGNIILNANNMLLALTGESISTAIEIADIAYTQSAITSVQLIGAQVVDYLYIQKGDIEQSENQFFTPVWNENTLFFANFVEPAPNQLQAGTVSATGEYQNAIYRIESGNVLKPIITLPTNVLQFKDYGIKSQQTYSYELFYLNNAQQSGYSAPVQSKQICKTFYAYSLIEATEDSENPNVYHVLKVWRFGNNISAGMISNNNTPNWLTNFTPYRLRQPSSRLGESGTLQALLANYNQSENFYSDTAQMMQELKQASVSNNTFFLKDMKGNLYMVGISAPITQTINLKTKLQEVTFSVSWEEVGDASNISLIQLETDPGWQKDEVVQVRFIPDAQTGQLRVVYPFNYNGTTFELIAYTPYGIKSGNIQIVDGAVIVSNF